MQEQAEKMRALDEKCRRFPGPKAVHHSKVAVAEKEQLLHVFSELSQELVLQRLKHAMQCSDLVLNALSLVFDEETFPPKSLLTCIRCGSEFDLNYNILTSCTLSHSEIDRIHKTSRGSIWRCDKCGEEWESSYYDTFDDVGVGHCFTGPHTAVVESESDSDEVF